MYNTRPGLLIGFHGCDKSRQQDLLINSVSMPISEKPYDWLGHGMYFWENNADRALEWAKAKESAKKIEEAAVIGAVIDLGHCCDFLDSSFTKMLTAYHNLMKIELEKVGKSILENEDLKSDRHHDKLLRYLDCATLEFMHEQIRTQYKKDMAAKNHSSLKIFDSVRGAFLEGGAAYIGSGFCAKSHIQICIRNSNCIKGYFLKRDELDFILQESTR
ncbi:MAG TPA: hypothetical protein VGM63_00235 [Mucilaginibacter sp.]|jgi:hypothetical protein